MSVERLAYNDDYGDIPHGDKATQSKGPNSTLNPSAIDRRTNFTLEQTAGSHALAAAVHHGR